MVLCLFEWCYVQAIQFYLLQNDIFRDWFEGFLDLISSDIFEQDWDVVQFNLYLLSVYRRKSRMYYLGRRVYNQLLSEIRLAYPLDRKIPFQNDKCRSYLRLRDWSYNGGPYHCVNLINYTRIVNRVSWNKLSLAARLTVFVKSFDLANRFGYLIFVFVDSFIQNFGIYCSFDWLIRFDCNNYRRYEKSDQSSLLIFRYVFHLTIFRIRFLLLVGDELALFSLFDAWLDNFREILNWLYGFSIFLFVRLEQEIPLPAIFFIAQGVSMLLISISGQSFCEIVMPNWSKRSRPRIGLNPSATTLFCFF